MDKKFQNLETTMVRKACQYQNIFERQLAKLRSVVENNNHRLYQPTGTLGHWAYSCGKLYFNSEYIYIENTFYELYTYLDSDINYLNYQWLEVLIPFAIE